MALAVLYVTYSLGSGYHLTGAVKRMSEVSLYLLIVQRYLAHKKPHPSIGLPYIPAPGGPERALLERIDLNSDSFKKSPLPRRTSLKRESSVLTAYWSESTLSS